MFGHDSQYDRDINEFLGDEIRVNKNEDGTVVSHVYECKSCNGLGGYDASRNCEEYDDWHDCKTCGGKGEIEVEV